jgi:hypothetical protein
LKSVISAVQQIKKFVLSLYHNHLALLNKIAFFLAFNEPKSHTFLQKVYSEKFMHIASLATSGIQLPSFSSPAENKEISTTSEATKRVAQEIFTELKVAITFCAISSFFVTSLPAAAILLIATISLIAGNALLRYLTLHTPQNTQGFLQKFMALNFAMFDTTTREILTHECGHALAATLLFKDANASVSLFPFIGGLTRFFPDTLSSLGKKVGREMAYLIVTASGPLAALLVSSVALALCYMLEESHPQLTKYLSFCSFSSLGNHFLYALSALGVSPEEEEGHDFVFLWKNGHIHPLVSALTILLIPLFLKLIFWTYRQMTQEVSSLKEKTTFFASPQGSIPSSFFSRFCFF